MFITNGIMITCFRMEIITYLKRPDLKQECLRAWQANYNAIPSNLRTDAVMLAEQHQCVDVSFILKYTHFVSVTVDTTFIHTTQNLHV